MRAGRRALGAPLKRDMDMRKRLWQYAGLYAGFMGVVYLGYQGYQRYRDPPAFRRHRTSVLQQQAEEKTTYPGLPRRNEAEDLYRRMEKAMVVLYHPLAHGKSQLVAYIKSTSDRPCLVVKNLGSLDETLQQFGFPASAVGVLNIATFQDTLESTLKALTRPILVLDSPDQMPEVLAQRLVMLGYRLKRSGLGDAIVVSSSVKTITRAQACGEAEVVVLADLEKGDFWAMGRLLALEDREIGLIYEACGASLEVLTAAAAAKPQQSPAQYIDSLRKSLRTTLKEALAAKPHLKAQLLKALDTVSESRPLGDVFSGSELARILTESRLAAAFPEGSTRFRDFLALAVVREIRE